MKYNDVIRITGPTTNNIEKYSDVGRSNSSKASAFIVCSDSRLEFKTKTKQSPSVTVISVIAICLTSYLIGAQSTEFSTAIRGISTTVSNLFCDLYIYTSFIYSNHLQSIVICQICWQRISNSKSTTIGREHTHLWTNRNVSRRGDSILCSCEFIFHPITRRLPLAHSHLVTNGLASVCSCFLSQQVVRTPYQENRAARIDFSLIYFLNWSEFFQNAGPSSSAVENQFSSTFSNTKILIRRRANFAWFSNFCEASKWTQARRIWECRMRIEVLVSCNWKSTLYADIELAKKNGFPKRLWSKLDGRKINCMELMKNLKTGEPYRVEAKLSFPPNVETPGFSDGIEIARSTNGESRVVTKRDLEIGQTVIIEEPYEMVSEMLFNYRQCSNCFKGDAKLIPCSKCTRVMYCSRECQKARYEKFHEIECAINYRFIVWEASQRLVFRTIRWPFAHSERSTHSWRPSNDSTRWRNSTTPSKIISNFSIRFGKSKNCRKPPKLNFAIGRSQCKPSSSTKPDWVECSIRRRSNAFWVTWLCIIFMWSIETHSSHSAWQNTRTKSLSARSMSVELFSMACRSTIRACRMSRVFMSSTKSSTELFVQSKVEQSCSYNTCEFDCFHLSAIFIATLESSPTDSYHFLHFRHPILLNSRSRPEALGRLPTEMSVHVMSI